MIYNNTRAFLQVMGHANLSEEQMAKHIHHRLKEVLASAYAHVPYYRELMKQIRYNPHRDYQGPGDLSYFPVTTKADIKKYENEYFINESEDPTRWISDYTSGSTGIPLTVYRNRYEWSIQTTKWLRVLFMNGYSVHDKVLSLTSPGRLKLGKSILQKFGLLRRIAINFHLPPEEMVNILLEYQPHVLYGTRTCIDTVAIELKRRGKQYKGLKLLVVTGEVIRTHTRNLCRNSFGVEPVESYGSVEMGVMAHETPARNGLRLCEDTTYFEFLDAENKPVPWGLPGRVIVTDLYSKTMPFIRYDQGDTAICQKLNDSDSGTVLRLTKIDGRDNDAVLVPEGSPRPLHPLDFQKVMNSYQQIHQYRVVQKTNQQIQILVSAEPGYFDKIRGPIQSSLQEHFPSEFNFEIRRVESIQPDPSGKLRMFISQVNSNTSS